MTTITIKTWPRGMNSLTEAALRHCLGDDPVLRVFDRVARPQPDAALSPEAALSPQASKRSAAQIPGRRYLVEYDDFPCAVIRRFDHAVGAGEAEDSAVGFRRFASADFTAYTAFTTHWVNSDFVQDQIVINTTDLYQNPVPWLQWALGLLNPGNPPSAGQLDRISALAPAWMAARIAEQGTADPIADLTGFRHYDAVLFDQLAGFVLRRDIVLQVFKEMLGRIPTEDAMRNFQGMASRAALRRHILASQEYVQREARAMSALGSYDQVTPAMLNSPAYRRREMAQKNALGWPLNQVFISRKAGLIYCPIGKVACTFLKRQMVQISDVAHKEEILKNVHALTDWIRTGMQLSDYPLDVARDFITSPDIVKFAVLRAPQDRLLSAYIEKFVINRTAPTNIHHTRSVLEQVQGRRQPGAVQSRPKSLPIDADTGITFRQFISEITRQPSDRLDPHWRPQADYLDGIRYDRLLRFDAMDAVIDLLELRSGQTLSRQPQNVTGSGSGKSNIAATDLLPAALMALPKLDKSCFFDADIRAAIASYFSADEALLQQTYDEARP